MFAFPIGAIVGLLIIGWIMKHSPLWVSYIIFGLALAGYVGGITISIAAIVAYVLGVYPS